MRWILVAALLGGALLANAGTAAAHTCFDVQATIVGTKHDDRIHGTSGRDVIVGLGGDDTIRGLGEADRLCGNGGNDKLIAGDGVDKADGGSGRNVLKGGSGDDTLFGGPSVDSFWPGAGNDVVDGKGSSGQEWVHYEHAGGPVHVDLSIGHATGDGTDILVAILDVAGSRFGDFVKGDEGDNVLRLGKGNDHGRGKGGDDRILGGPGADDLDGGAGANVNDGGDGHDHCLNPDPVSGALHCESP
ncbi:MAG TPA: calcium-binding protein [Gaiellaceae bacterium]|jgi:Ca2+-binding RTX toxin-like protein